MPKSKNKQTKQKTDDITPVVAEVVTVISILLQTEETMIAEAIPLVFLWKAPIKSAFL